MEVYNELLYDLLENSEKPLELREDPKVGAVVVGLKRILVSSWFISRNVKPVQSLKG